MQHPPPNPRPPTVIAVDGPAASGKGTLARAMAAHFGFDYLDTGLLYRAVAYFGEVTPPVDAAAELAAATLARVTKLAASLDPQRLNDPHLKSEKIAAAASYIATFPALRAALRAYQVNFAQTPPGGLGAVLDGRDIGSVICPDAKVKFFITAAVEVRAKRRFLELYGQGHKVVYAAILHDLIARDRQDSGRQTAPLTEAKDAIRLDTSTLSLEDARDFVLAKAQVQLS
ncbi:MAG: (d)CMP kinase [Candidatus Symbiobacter sp.]|nr:(d)CMP kinase [Candidatus Symbiobacter sp.]